MRLLPWLMIVGGFVLLAAQCSSQKDSTDPPGGRSGLSIYVDHYTGCQYLSSSWGGLTPRLDTDGRHICGGPI